MKGSAVRIRASALADLQGNRLGQRSSLARGFGTFPCKSVFQFVLKPRARTRLTLGLGPCRSDLSRLERIAGSTSLGIRGVYKPLFVDSSAGALRAEAPGGSVRFFAKLKESDTPLWVSHTNSPPVGASPPATSRAGKAAPSMSSLSSASRSACAAENQRRDP